MESDAVGFAGYEKIHCVAIHQSDFAEIENNFALVLLAGLDEVSKMRDMFGLKASAKKQLHSVLSDGPFLNSQHSPVL
jgi:hypothetical protein